MRHCHLSRSQACCAAGTARSDPMRCRPGKGCRADPCRRQVVSIRSSFMCWREMWTASQPAFIITTVSPMIWPLSPSGLGKVRQRKLSIHRAMLIVPLRTSASEPPSTRHKPSTGRVDIGTSCWKPGMWGKTSASRLANSGCLRSASVAIATPYRTAF